MSLICNKTQVNPEDWIIPLGSKDGKVLWYNASLLPATSRNTANSSSNRTSNRSKRGCPRTKPEPTSCHQTVVIAASHSHQPPLTRVGSHRHERPQNWREESCRYLGRRYLARKETVRENFSRLSSLNESCRQDPDPPAGLSRSNLVDGRQGERAAPLRCLCNPTGVWTHVLGLLFYDTPVRRQEKKRRGGFRWALGNGVMGTNGNRKQDGGSSALRDSIGTLIRQLVSNEARCFGGEKLVDVAWKPACRSEKFQPCLHRLRHRHVRASPVLPHRRIRKTPCQQLTTSRPDRRASHTPLSAYLLTPERRKNYPAARLGGLKWGVKAAQSIPRPSIGRQ